MRKNYQNVVRITIAMLFSSASLFAQNAIKGTAFEKETGKPLPYVYVYVKGSTSNATLTSDDGTYSINAAADAVLVFSSLGYVTIEELVGNRSTINVSMGMDSFGLEEVIAVAYATTRRGDLTSSVASVRGEELSKAPTSGFNEAMQGKMAGVQIFSASGTPGGAITVRVRGASSITAGNDPLYVVDGIPMTAADYSQIGFGGQTTNPMAAINPSDIESLQVLKDAAAASLYGSRASNGVVLITTKQGRAQKTRVTLDAYYGVQNLRRKVEFLGTDEWLQAQNEARSNYNTSLGYTSDDSRFIKPIAAEVPGVNTDWFDEVTKKNPMLASAQLGVTGGSDQTQFYLSAGWYRQVGLQRPSDYERYNFRARINHRINQKVRIDFNASLGTSDSKRMYGDNNIYGPIMTGSRSRPDQPVYDPNDPSKYYITINNNPVACFKEASNLNRNQRLSGSLKLEWKIFNDITFNSSLSADYTNIHEFSKYSSKAPQAQLYQDESRDASVYVYNYLVENMLNYNKKFGTVVFSALVGQSFQQRINHRSSVSAVGFPLDSFKWLTSASKNSAFSSSMAEFLMESYFARISANIDNKYMLEATARTDASSRFAKSYRWGLFPSASLGWRVSKESFFPQNWVLTDTKLRASVGLTGNQEGISDYRYLTVYDGGRNYDLLPGMSPSSTMSTPDLTWEKTLQTDIGLDLVFMNGRIEFTYDFFLKNTMDVLLSRSVPITTGHTTKTENLGKIRNMGHEFSIFSRNVMHPKFKWNTSLNFTYIDNKVTEIGKNANGEWEWFTTGQFSIIDVGYPSSTFYLIKATGIYQKDSDVPESLYRMGVRAGDVIYEDVNGDGVINASDKQKSKSGLAPIYGGLTNTFAYQGFDLELGLQYSIGNWVYSFWKESAGAYNGGRSLMGMSKDHWDNRWTPENPHNDPYYPRFVYGSSGASSYNTQTATTRWLQDASFLRVKTLNLGYTLPSQIGQKINVDRVRLYVNAQNLFTFTKFDGMDPEIDFNPGAASSEKGVDFFTVPQLRSVIFGVNITF